MLLARFLIVFLLAAIEATMSPLGEVHAASETMPVYRAQLRVSVCDVKDAATGDDVKVKLNSENKTYLDYARNDLERNSTFTYDLVLENISTLSDIRNLDISKNGTDGLCLRALTLIVNNQSIFKKTFPGRHWLDKNDRTLTIPSSELRQHPWWIAYSIPFPPLAISRQELESRIESLVGTRIQGSRLYWGKLHGRGVEVKKKDQDSVDVDLDLALDVPYWFDVEVDFNFDINLCKNGNLDPKVMNAKVDLDSPWYSEFITLGFVDYLERLVASMINAALRGLSMPLPGGSLPSGLPCPKVQDDGDISFF